MQTRTCAALVGVCLMQTLLAFTASPHKVTRTFHGTIPRFEYAAIGQPHFLRYRYN